jgi:hypothetical protein
MTSSKFVNPINSFAATCAGLPGRDQNQIFLALDDLPRNLGLSAAFLQNVFLREAVEL